MTAMLGVRHPSVGEGAVEALLQADAVRVSETHCFTYAAGDAGPVFLDLNRLYSCRAPGANKSPWERIGGDLLPHAFREACKKYGNVDALLAVATGGIHVASIIGWQVHLPYYTFRPVASDGRNYQIEGGLQGPIRLAVVDDVIRTDTTGVLKALRVLRHLSETQGLEVTVPFVFGLTNYGFKKTRLLAESYTDLYPGRGVGVAELITLPSVLAEMGRMLARRDPKLSSSVTSEALRVVKSWHVEQGG